MKSIPSIRNVGIEGYFPNDHRRTLVVSDGRDFVVSRHTFGAGDGHPMCALHTHDCYELELLTVGRIRQYLDGAPFDMSMRDFVLLSDKNIHTCETLCDGVELLNIKFSADMLTPETGRRLGVLPCPVIGSLGEEQSAYVAHTVDALARAKEHVADSEAFAALSHSMIESLILYLLACGNVSASPLAATSQKDTMIDAILYVREHFRENLTLAFMAERFGYSYNYFGNRFKELTGSTFTAYLDDLRLTCAYGRVLLGSESLDEIRLSVGFASLSYFHRRFKKKYSCSPGHLRGIK